MKSNLRLVCSTVLQSFAIVNIFAQPANKEIIFSSQPLVVVGATKEDRISVIYSLFIQFNFVELDRKGKWSC